MWWVSVYHSTMFRHVARLQLYIWTLNVSQRWEEKQMCWRWPWDGIMFLLWPSISIHSAGSAWKNITNLTVFINLHIRLNCSLNQSPRKPFRVILNLADNVELTLLYSEELKMFLWNKQCEDRIHQKKQCKLMLRKGQLCLSFPFTGNLFYTLDTSSQDTVFRNYYWPDWDSPRLPQVWLVLCACGRWWRQ